MRTYCTSCGARLGPRDTFCTTCGASTTDDVVGSHPGYCTRCGTPLSSGETFCTSCGAPVTPSPALVQTTPWPLGVPSPRRASLRPLVLVLILVVAAVALGGFAWFAFSAGSGPVAASVGECVYVDTTDVFYYTPVTRLECEEWCAQLLVDFPDRYVSCHFDPF